MAEVAGVFAASHTPVMLNFADAVAAVDRDAVFAAFKDLGARIAACRPEVLVVISDDHLHNFFLDNFPAVCIGAAAAYPTPVEHWLKADKRTLPGHAGFAAHLLNAALESFDPSFSMELTLDHGILTPLELAGVARDLPIVPLLINCVQPPMPAMERCLQWGKLLHAAIASYTGVERIAVLATGGLSHDLATPRMGMLNDDFDREFVRLLGASDDRALAAFARDHVHEAGNGAEEVRTWLVARGAAAGAPLDVLFHKGLTDWYTGICIAQWDLAARGAVTKELV
jgi:aromatic ring-opening dioxygenase catalytic subunit (LigB family)